MGAKGYKIKLQFNLNDSSSVVIYPSGHNNIKNNDYEKMFILLENKYIPIIDKHNLRPTLKHEILNEKENQIIYEDIYEFIKSAKD